MIRLLLKSLMAILTLAVFTMAQALDVESMPLETFLKETANVDTHERAFELAQAVCESGRADLAVKCIKVPRLGEAFVTTLLKMEPSQKKDEIVMALMQQKWPDDREPGDLPIGSRGPPVLEIIAIRVISSRLPKESLKEDVQSFERLSSHSERMKLVKEFRDVLQSGKAGSPQPANIPEPPKENPPAVLPATPAPIVTPAASRPVVPTVAANPAAVVERKSLVWPWVVGIGALTVIALLVWKRRA